MSFEEEIKIAHSQIMSIEEFVSKHSSIPKEYVKKVRYMTDQLVEGEWKGLSLDMVDGLFLDKQRVREAILTTHIGYPNDAECADILLKRLGLE